MYSVPLLRGIINRTNLLKVKESGLHGIALKHVRAATLSELEKMNNRVNYPSYINPGQPFCLNPNTRCEVQAQDLKHDSV